MPVHILGALISVRARAGAKRETSAGERERASAHAVVKREKGLGGALCAVAGNFRRATENKTEEQHQRTRADKEERARGKKRSARQGGKRSGGARERGHAGHVDWRRRARVGRHWL